MQEQVYPPSVLMQIWVGLHWCDSDAHSSTSAIQRIIKHYMIIQIQKHLSQLQSPIPIIKYIKDPSEKARKKNAKYIWSSFNHSLWGTEENSVLYSPCQGTECRRILDSSWETCPPNRCSVSYRADSMTKVISSFFDIMLHLLVAFLVNNISEHRPIGNL